jgi:predicted CoA-binding protein
MRLTRGKIDIGMSKKAENGRAVAVVGASPKPHRYAHRAMQMLREYGHRAVPVNPAFREILGEKCYPSVTEIPDKIDTITLYVSKARSAPLIGEIVDLAPRRIIMNPGAENSDLAIKARERGIEVVEGCTLVMLRAGQF